MVPNLLSLVFDGRHEFEPNSPGLTITLGYNMQVAKNVLSLLILIIKVPVA